MRIFENAVKAFDIILPKRCLACERPLRTGLLCSACALPPPVSSVEGRCLRCFSFLPLEPEISCPNCHSSPLPFRQVRFLWPYAGNFKDALRGMKYKGHRSLSSVFSAALLEALPALYPWPDWDLILPVPISSKGLVQRGFNQCLTLAETCAAYHPSASVKTSALLLRRRHRAQATLNTSARKSNVTNAFMARQHLIFGKTVLLVDDVLTTGATAINCFKALANAGARSVDLITLARSEKLES